MFSFFKQDTADFKLRRRLLEHKRPVTVLATSPDGKWLASGAGDGVKCWELSTGSRVEFDHTYQSFRGQVSGIAWLKAATNLDVLCYVTGLGYIVTCCLSSVEAKFQESFCTNIPQGIAPNSEITSVVANSSTGRLVTGSRNCHIQLWQLRSKEEKLEHKQELELLFDIKLNFVPRCLAFIETKDHNIFAFATYNGQWNKLSGRDGKIIDSGDIHKPMGSTAIDVPANRFVIDNATNGFDLHRLHERRIPKQVVFAEDGRLVAGGSDHGKIYLFDRDSGRLQGTLPHARRQVVQTVTAHNSEKETHLERNHQSPKWTFKDTLDYILKILAVLVLSFYMLQNQVYKDSWVPFNPWGFKEMPYLMHTRTIKQATSTSHKTLGSVPPSVPPLIPQDGTLYMAAVQEIVQKTLEEMSTVQLLSDSLRVNEERKAEAAKRRRQNAEKSIVFA
ncbi:hypothetical protein M422DRAFT_247365 [Sphaerobolus stellatus SS14]|nr:hypothetical protein M422DRAFT_247365 [Sphaerobolus stellatus SS14]